MSKSSIIGSTQALVCARGCPGARGTSPASPGLSRGPAGHQTGGSSQPTFIPEVGTHPRGRHIRWKAANWTPALALPQPRLLPLPSAYPHLPREQTCASGVSGTTVMSGSLGCSAHCWCLYSGAHGAGALTGHPSSCPPGVKPQRLLLVTFQVSSQYKTLKIFSVRHE